jgi:hypothetical protein
LNLRNRCSFSSFSWQSSTKERMTLFDSTKVSSCSYFFCSQPPNPLLINEKNPAQKQHVRASGLLQGRPLPPGIASGVMNTNARNGFKDIHQPLT